MNEETIIIIMSCKRCGWQQHGKWAGGYLQGDSAGHYREHRATAARLLLRTSKYGKRYPHQGSGVAKRSMNSVTVAGHGEQIESILISPVARSPKLPITLIEG